jgi:hypothetical protein
MGMLRTPDRRDCKLFPLKTVFSCLRIPFGRGSVKDRVYCTLRISTLYGSIRMRLCQSVPQVLSVD